MRLRRRQHLPQPVQVDRQRARGARRRGADPDRRQQEGHRGRTGRAGQRRHRGVQEARTALHGGVRQDRRQRQGVLQGPGLHGGGWQEGQGRNGHQQVAEHNSHRAGAPGAGRQQGEP